MTKLLITSTELMMIQFLVPHVKYLTEQGYHVEIACSDVGGRMEDVRSALEGVVKKIHTLRLERSPLSPRNALGYQDLRRLLKENHYDIIWTNEPVMGVITRLAANKYRRKGTKVVYMCHGFHFFKGAGALNWLVFYPIERFMSRFCDCIVTMNEEDCRRAQTFHAKRVEKIPGVGVDAARFQAEVSSSVRSSKRQELGIPQDAYLLLSVGELTKRKNHEIVLRALQELNDPSIQYAICGVGNLQPYLESLVQELGLQQQVHFLGYRMDIPDMMHTADCFLFPSLQEGLPFALMEAMSCGLPIIASRIRGNVDLIDDPEGGILCDVHSSSDFSAAIQRVRSTDTSAYAAYNRTKVKGFYSEHTKPLLAELFRGIISGEPKE